MSYNNILINNIEYLVEDSSLKRLFADVILVRLDETRTKVHAPYLPVDAIVDKSLETMIKIVNEMKYEKYIDLIIGRGAILEDIINCFTNKFKNNQ